MILQSGIRLAGLVSLLQLGAFFGPFSAPTLANELPQTTPTQLKVLTLNFNSENFLNDPTFQVRDLRFEGLKKWVKENDPDIILLEEAWSYRGEWSVARTIARAIGYDISTRLEMGFFDLFFEADAVLAKKSLQMSEPFAIKLPHSAWEIGNGNTWVIELGSVSYAVGAKLTLANGEPVFVYVSHLTGNTPADRGDQAQAIVADAQTRSKAAGVGWDKANVIIGGDLNSRPTDPAAQAILHSEFMDTFEAAHPGDSSCSLCEIPESAWFNPFTIAPGQVPSQATDQEYSRVDYIFSHSRHFLPLASTLTFTAPYNGIWMSDHYGVTTTFANYRDSGFPNPTHDSPESIAPAAVQKITPEMLVCPHHYPGDCSMDLPDLTVDGPRGIAVENRSEQPIFVEIYGRGKVYANNSASLNPGEQAAFSFPNTGNFTYQITTHLEHSDLRQTHQTILNGKIEVRTSGY